MFWQILIILAPKCTWHLGDVICAICKLLSDINISNKVKRNYIHKGLLLTQNQLGVRSLEMISLPYMGTVVKRSYSFQWGTGKWFTFPSLYGFLSIFFGIFCNKVWFVNVFKLFKHFSHYFNISSWIKSVYYVVLPEQQQQNGRLWKHEIFS